MLFDFRTILPAVLSLVVSGCLSTGCDGMGGRDLTGRLVPDTKVALKLPAGYGFTYASGKDVRVKLRGVNANTGKIDELDFESVASPVVDADSRYMAASMDLLLRQQERIQERDRISLEIFGQIMQSAIGMVGGAWGPNMRPASSSNISMPTPWGNVGIERSTGTPAPQPAPIPATTTDPPLDRGGAVPADTPVIGGE